MTLGLCARLTACQTVLKPWNRPYLLHRTMCKRYNAKQLKYKERQHQARQLRQMARNLVTLSSPIVYSITSTIQNLTQHQDPPPLYVISFHAMLWIVNENSKLLENRLFWYNNMLWSPDVSDRARKWKKGYDLVVHGLVYAIRDKLKQVIMTETPK